jgi:hypothetical protein
MSTKLDLEIGVYYVIKPWLLLSHPGEYAVICGYVLAGCRGSYEEALALGYDCFGAERPFLVKHIVEVEPVIHQANLLSDPVSGKLVLAPWVTVDTESRLAEAESRSDDPASDPTSDSASDPSSSPASRCSRALGDDFGRDAREKP